MVKHIQTICRQIASELSVFYHFVDFTLKGLGMTDRIVMVYYI